MALAARVQCSSCGGWMWAGDAHTCPPGPADLPVVRAGTTYRFHVVDHTLLILRARLEHDAAPLIGASL